MKNCSVVVLFAFFFSHIGIGYPTQAVVVVPIADAVGSPADTNKKLSIEGQGIGGCNRVHQLLCNEHVSIIEEWGEWAKIDVHTVFFVGKFDTTTKQHTFWTLKKNLMPVSSIPNSQNLPQPVDFTSRSTPSQQVVSLIIPWHDNITGKTYSAGTRFVEVKPPTKKWFYAYIFEPKTRRWQVGKIPQSHGIINNENTTAHEKISQFLAILYAWSHLPEGFIPYVWGGDSYNTPCMNDNFDIVPLTPGSDVTYIQRSHFDYSPLSGLDCSNMISRAAQLVGIPYFYKNSFTASTFLKPVARHENIEVGDIFWIPGHVMVVADINKNTLYEARSHYHGYGKVQEIPISEEFKGIETFDHLKKALYTGQVLERLNIQGKVVQKIPNFKILKMRSTFDNRG